MIPTRFTLAACLAALGPLAHAQPAPPVTAVVLYPGAATIERTAQIPAGTSQVVFSGLPARFDTQTLQAEGSAQVRVGHLVVRDAAQAAATNPAEAELEAKIQALHDQKDALEAEESAAATVKKYLEQVAERGGAAVADKPASIDAKTLAAMADTLGRSAGDTAGRLHRLALQKRDIERKIGVLERDLAKLRTGGRETRTVAVQVTAERPGTVKLRYQVGNAGWKPAYRAALDSASGRLEIERMALVAQKTGEDWKNVRVTLSTALPRQGQGVPEPAPWWLVYLPPRPAVAAGAKVQFAPAPAAAPAPAPAMRSMAREDAYEPPTFETHGSFATEFAVPAPVDLPADGREVSLPLARQAIAARHYLRITPRLERAAVVMAEAARPEGVWPAGSTQLVLDGAYVGSTHWNPAATDKFTLSFGRDDLVRVRVDALDQQSGSSGVFDRKATRSYADVFTVTNAHRAPVDVLVLESSPVSGSEEIAAEASFDPKPTTPTWSDRAGVVAWEKKIAPGESSRFQVKYRIAYPQEGTVPSLR